MSTTQVADEAPAEDQAEDQERDGRAGEPRPEKVAVVDAVRDELSSNPATLLTEYRGLSVGELAELRADLREAGADYVVVKNTLARIAARDAGFEGLVEFLTGPTALTYCSDDPVGPAKALRRFSKDHPELVIKGGILEGRVVDAETADKLADLESREDLLARLAQLMYGALANTASLLQAPLSKMARLLAAYQEEGDLPEGEAPAETPAAEDEPEVAETDEAEAIETDEPEAAEADEEPDAAEEPETAEEDEPEAAEVDEEPEATEAEEEPDADEPEAAEAEDEPESAADEDEAAGAVETVADTAADAVETATDVADTAVEAATETAKDVAEDTPVEGAVEAAADVTEAVADAATDTVEGAAETTAAAVAGSDEDEADAADADDDEADDEDDEDDEEQS